MDSICGQLVQYIVCTCIESGVYCIVEIASHLKVAGRRDVTSPLSLLLNILEKKVYQFRTEDVPKSAF